MINFARWTVFFKEDFVYYISTDLVSWPNVLMKRCEI